MSQNNPGALAAAALKATLSDSATVSYFGPYAKFAASTVSPAYDISLGQAVESASDAAIGMLTDAAAQLANGVLSDVAAGVSSIPLIGTIASVVLGGAVDIATQVMAEDSDDYVPSQACLDDEAARDANRSTSGIHPDGSPYRTPADVFALRFQDKTRRSVLGEVFVRIAEGQREDPSFDFPGAPDSYEANYQKVLQTGITKHFGAMAGSSIKAKGIPAKTRARMRFLRRAMQSTWRVSGTDGGVSLWPIYLDCLAREFDSKRMSRELAWWLWTHEVEGGHVVKARPDGYAGCWAAQRASFNQAMAIIKGWLAARKPTYLQDASAKAKLEASLADVPDMARSAAIARSAGVSLFQAPIKLVSVGPQDHAHKSLVRLAMAPRFGIAPSESSKAVDDAMVLVLLVGSLAYVLR